MVTPADLNDLLERRVPEDQWLEYKDGEWLQGASPAAKLREYVSAFANADGGVLIVGVRGHERNDHDHDNARPGWSVAACTVTRLREWAEDALKDIAHFLSPPARTHVVQHERGEVLVIGVAKAPNLIDVYEGRRTVTYLRNGHATFAMSESLQVDLRLGRRVQPHLSLSVREQSFGSIQALMSNLVVETAVENNGLLWVAEAVYGWVGYAHSSQNQTERPASGLTRYLEIVPLAESWTAPAKLLMRCFPLKALQPFRRAVQSLSVALPTPLRSSERFRWQGVVFVIPRDSPPTFVQVDCVLSTQPSLVFSCAEIVQGGLGRIQLGDHAVG
jgi:hypothetical protein